MGAYEEAGWTSTLASCSTNRYRLGRLVGSGGMATVYAATDVRLQRAVAVKLFHPGADDIALARLEAEARLLAGLSHPGLLRVFDVGTAAGRPYLVMQLIDGCTLRTVINRGPTPPEPVARLGARLAETLRYVHSRRIVHRDLKPSNVLLDGSGRCYLADFGIARALGAARLTGSGNCVGTAAYLAPEQVAGEAVGPPADIYSLGLVLLECLTGRPEYTGSEVEAAVARLSRPRRTGRRRCRRSSRAGRCPGGPGSAGRARVAAGRAEDGSGRGPGAADGGEPGGGGARARAPAGRGARQERRRQGRRRQVGQEDGRPGLSAATTLRAQLPVRSSAVHSIGSGSTD